ESLAFGPSAAACQPLAGKGFGDKIGAICDELCVDAQNGAERPFDLCGRIVVRLQAAHRGFNQRVQGADVSFRGEAKNNFRLKGHRHGRCYFGRTAIRSISTRAPRVPAGRTTCSVVRAGLYGWSLVPKNWEYPAIIPAKSSLPSFAGSAPR